MKRGKEASENNETKGQGRNRKGEKIKIELRRKKGLREEQGKQEKREEGETGG